MLARIGARSLSKSPVRWWTRFGSVPSGNSVSTFFIVLQSISRRSSTRISMKGTPELNTFLLHAIAVGHHAWPERSVEGFKVQSLIVRLFKFNIFFPLPNIEEYSRAIWPKSVYSVCAVNYLLFKSMCCWIFWLSPSESWGKPQEWRFRWFESVGILLHVFNRASIFGMSSRC